MAVIKVTITKTFQEKQFEPWSCSLEAKKNVPDDNHYEELDKLQYELEYMMDGIIKERRNKWADNAYS